MRFFKWLFLGLVIILGIFSILAIVSIHWHLFSKYHFEFSPIGINTYISSFEKYKALFAATGACFSIYFVVMGLLTNITSNMEKIKNDRFTEWKNILDIRLIETDINDPYLKKIFISNRHSLFLKLDELNYSVNNKSELIDIFNSYFRDSIAMLEKMNKNHMKYGGVYRDKNHSYSFNSFEFIFLGTLKNKYPGIQEDLNELFLNSIDINRTIDEPLYLSSINNTISRNF